ncbi:hypothetical protein SPONN_474 [uncultured Candidatus Thioglobus sp.]|nr:hypothetical protein SPONL_301 [uncultured Candidatus Thioglobus sp.]SMM99346.1 hypothetical protein SPONN_474 [uncultured Candidatus Thioglobus sp.]
MLSSASLADYSVQLAERGIVFSDLNKTRLKEAQLCNGNYCLFVEKIELDLLNIDLGDDTNEIFANLKKMSELEKNWLVNQLESIDRLTQ